METQSSAVETPEEKARLDDRVAAEQKHPDIVRAETRRQRRAERLKQAEEERKANQSKTEEPRPAKVESAEAKQLREGRQAVANRCARLAERPGKLRAELVEAEAELAKAKATLGDLEGAIITAKEQSRISPERAMETLDRAEAAFKKYFGRPEKE